MNVMGGRALGVWVRVGKKWWVRYSVKYMGRRLRWHCNDSNVYRTVLSKNVKT
jgi:hypothetical protein